MSARFRGARASPTAGRGTIARPARSWVLLLVAAALLGAGYLYFSGTLASLVGEAGTDSAVVQRVIDGDTIVVEFAGAEERVRLLNIDTPESVKPNSTVECLGEEASEFLRELLPRGTEVTLVFDREQRDRYGRMLAGVVTADGTLVNAEIARAGLAESLVVGDNDRFERVVDAAVRDAKDGRRGLWAPGACA